MVAGCVQCPAAHVVIFRISQKQPSLGLTWGSCSVRIAIAAQRLSVSALHRLDFVALSKEAVGVSCYYIV